MSLRVVQGKGAEAIHGERFATREQAKAHTFEYIEVYYHRQRLHLAVILGIRY